MCAKRNQCIPCSWALYPRACRSSFEDGDGCLSELRRDRPEGRPSGGLSEILAHDRADLLRFLKARCANHEEAEDVLQELWIRASSQTPGPIDNARAYLFRMANNMVIDRSRSRRRAMARDRAWLADDGIGSNPEQRPDRTEAADEVIIREQEADILRAAVEALPPGARRALTLYRFQGHSQGEVAQIMGITRSGVEKNLALALRRLRTALLNCGYFDAAPSWPQEHGGGKTVAKDDSA